MIVVSNMSSNVLDESVIRLKNALLTMNEDQRLQFISSLSLEQAEAIKYDWRISARPEQLLPNRDFFTWLLLCGRGWGKTKTGSEAIISIAEKDPIRMALIGPLS